MIQPAPAPRPEQTRGSLRFAPGVPGRDIAEVLASWGMSDEQISEVRLSQGVAAS